MTNVTIDKEYQTETHNSTNGNRRAVIHADRFEVFFGQMISGEFQLSRFNPPREYKTAGAARRAASHWVNN